LVEALLHLEAPRRRDVLQVDAAERRGEAGDGLDQLVDVGGVQHDRHAVEAGETAEQLRLALHHGQRRLRTDVAQAQHRRAVRDDGDVVAGPGVFPGLLRIVVDGLAHEGYARGVGDGEVADAVEADLRGSDELAALVGAENLVAGDGGEGAVAVGRAGLAGGRALILGGGVPQGHRAVVVVMCHVRRFLVFGGGPGLVGGRFARVISALTLSDGAYRALPGHRRDTSRSLPGHFRRWNTVPRRYIT